MPDSAAGLPQPDLKLALAKAHTEYLTKNPESKRFFEKSLSVLPGGNTRTVIHANPFPLTFSQGKGNTLFTVDGDSYIDFLNEYSAGLYGHSCNIIKNAVTAALDNGWNFGGNTVLEKKLASIVVERFNFDMVRFTNSGTEATLMAIGAAINFTGRKKILVFSNGYHGSAFSFPGVASKYSMNAKYEFIQATYNDIAATEATLSELPSESLAAILVEPMQGSGGCIPGNYEFLAFLRKASKELKALLILDEVMTSRLAYGGLQSKLGIKPDLTTLGKWIGGGMNFGAFGGRSDVMEMFDPSVGKLTHSGTFNNNVVSMSAGIAGCQLYNSDAVAKVNGLGDQMRTMINEVIKKQIGPAESKMFARGIGSLLNVCFEGEEKTTLHNLFYHHMLKHGINIATRGFVTLSMEIKEEHVEKFVQAVESFVIEYLGALV